MPVKSLLSFLLSLALVWLAVIVLARFMERRFLYFPIRALAAEPADYGLRAEELQLTASDGVRLHGWWIRAKGERALLLFHGNGGNVSHRLERAKLFVEELGVDLFLVDYRGYGLSEGTPSEAGLYRDGRAIYDAARERGFPPERIVLHGESLGCAVAVDVALERPVCGLALETPFLSVPALARKHYPFVPAIVIRSRFDAASKVGRIAAPKLFVVAENDEIAPPSQGRALYELARPPKELFVVPGAGHNDTYAVGGRPYLDAWRRFLGVSPEFRSGRNSGPAPNSGRFGR